MKSAGESMSTPPCRHVWVITSEVCALCGQKEYRNELRNGTPDAVKDRMPDAFRMQQALLNISATVRNVLTQEQQNALGIGAGADLEWCVEQVFTAFSDADARARDALASREGWESVARDMAKNCDFWHGIVLQVGEMFGVEAKTADDGSIMEDVLALKVPELVRALLDRANATREPAKP